MGTQGEGEQEYSETEYRRSSHIQVLPDRDPLIKQYIRYKGDDNQAFCEPC